MVQIRLSVGSALKMSIHAVVGSGMTSMSEALMTFQPRMLEPSKPSPSEMLPCAGQIGEFEIHELHLVVFNHFADVGWSFFFGHSFR